MSLTTGSSPYSTDPYQMAAALSDATDKAERLLPPFRLRCLELTIDSFGHGGDATTQQVLDRAKAIEQYIREGT